MGKRTLYYKRLMIGFVVCMLLVGSVDSIKVDGKTVYIVKNHKLYHSDTQKLVVAMTAYKGKLYKNGVVYKKRTVFQKKLYVNGSYTKDKVKPSITVGAYKAQLDNGSKFEMPKVIAKDEVSGTLNVTTEIVNEAGTPLKNVNTNISGIYKITYTAIDLEKNKETKIIKIEILEPATLEILDVQ